MNEEIKSDEEYEKNLENLSLQFEKNLSETKKDPLEKAKARRKFYASQRELIAERLRQKSVEEKKRLTKERKIDNRQFEAFGDQYYSGTFVNDKIMEEEKLMNILSSQNFKNRIPVYLGDDSKLYDINYVPFSIEENTLLVYF
jgi:hypothetical protein